MSTENVDIRVRLQGGKVVQVEADGVAASIGNIGRKARQASASLVFLQNAGRGIKGTLSNIGGAARTGAKWTGLFFSGLAAFSAYEGLKFDSQMEQSSIAFKQFLGSGKEAITFTKQLFELSKHSPFRFAELLPIAQKLTAVGFSAQRAMKMIQAMSDTAAGAGKSGAQLNNLVLAIDEISSLGVLQGRQLRMLENFGISRDSIAKQVGMSGQEFAKAVSAKKFQGQQALDIVEAAMNSRFKGQAMKQSHTFRGLMTTFKDNYQQTMGAIMQGPYDWLKAKGFPAANKAMEDVDTIFNKKGLSTKEKFEQAWKKAKVDLTPLAKQISAQVKALDLPQKAGDAIKALTPKVMKGAGELAAMAVPAFIHGWLHSGAWGFLFGLAFLGSKLGVWKSIGALASRRFMTAFAARSAAMSGAMNGMWLKFGTKWGTLMRTGFVAAATIGLYQSLVGPFNQAMEDIFGVLNASDPTNGRAQAHADNQAAREGRLGHKGKGPGFFAWRRLHGPNSVAQRVWVPGKVPKGSKRTEGAYTTPGDVYLDGKKVGKVLAGNTQKQANRR